MSTVDVAALREAAEAAWIAYRNDVQWREPGQDQRRAMRRLRKRDFVAGYMAAGERLKAAEGAAVERVRALAASWTANDLGTDRLCAHELIAALDGDQ